MEGNTNREQIEVTTIEPRAILLRRRKIFQIAMTSSLTFEGPWSTW
jgi:hypothetical protein